MKILITGASGLVGQALTASLMQAGHQVVPLVRGEPGAGHPSWQPESSRVDLRGAEDVEGVIHLAGATIAQRWTASAKQRIRASRVQGTRLLGAALADLPRPPRLWISASATGFYGSRGEDWLDESSPAGTGFLADVCRDWEAATQSAAACGIRVVQLRLGMVITPRGGALARMLPIFKLGLGGPVGSGGQYWSWIALSDLVRLVAWILDQSELAGPVNAVAPEPVTSRELAQALGRALHRPAVLPVPAWAIGLLLGEMGRAVLLAGARVRPARALASGFVFRCRSLADGLAFEIASSPQL